MTRSPHIEEYYFNLVSDAELIKAIELRVDHTATMYMGRIISTA